jgi:TPR repeat protein
MQLESNADTGPPSPLALTITDQSDTAAPARRPWVRGLSIAALSVVVMGTLLGCDSGPGGSRGPGGPFAGPGATCPRPAIPVSSSPQFNVQQQEIHALRRAAFRGDFFAQLELARRYEGQKVADRNLEDPIESAVWYTMALTNASGYTPISAYQASSSAKGGEGRFDDCRRVERRFAYGTLDRLLGQMSSEEQAKVRDRVIYILAGEGAEGYRTLARVHDGFFGPFGEPPDNSEAKLALGRPDRPGAPSALNLFPRNDVDAYLYNYLAVQTGDVGAYVMLKDFEKSKPERGGYAQFVEAKAKRWTPPYEFYPPDAPPSGVPHSDETDWRDDVSDQALSRIGELPFQHVAEALAYLHVIPKSVSKESSVYPGDVQTLQAMLGRETTGKLSPIEKVRAIQYAAVNGSPKAQLVLAVMYSEGVGVPRDYARAFRWYAEADRQGSAEAKYAMSTFFSLGMAGIADQDKARAVVYQIDGALAGFKPSVTRLQQVLAQVSRGGRPRTRYGAGPGGPTGYDYPPAPGSYGAPQEGPPADYGQQPPPQSGYGPDDGSAAGDTTRPADAPPQGSSTGERGYR